MYRQLYWPSISLAILPLEAGGNQEEFKMVVVTTATAHLAGAKFPERVAG
jgi:hypothetical protein